MKGDPVLIPILFLNRSKEIWGEDALEFRSVVYGTLSARASVPKVTWIDRPERWQTPPEAASSIPGVWANMLTFLGGPHSCIGYRFAVIEYVNVHL